MYVVFRRERGEPVGYVQVLTRRARPVMIARMGEPSAFFVPDGERFLATALTRGPWSRDHQHGGPPSALLARAIERRLAGVAETEVVRLTVDFLRPLAIGPVEVRAEVVRAGRKVQEVAAALSAGGEVLCRASALAIRRA